MEITEMKKKDLPNATAVLVLAILSLVFCWCYGFVGLILGILAVAIASAPRKAYLEHPEEYTEISYKNLSAGRVCGIIGICVALAVVAFVILVVLGVTALGVGSALMLG